MEKKSIIIICKDTGVFVLLWHCFGLKNLEKDLYMTNFTEGKNIISLKDTGRNHEVMIPGLLSIHAISDCNTVPMFYGVARKEKS